MQDFGKNLNFLRKESGFKQEEISDLLGIKRTTWSDHERGKSEPPLDRLKAIADFFRVPVDWLFMDNAHLIGEYDKWKKSGKSAPICTPICTPNEENQPVFNEEKPSYNTLKSEENKDTIIASLREVIETQKELITSLKSNISLLKEKLGESGQ